MNKLSFPLYIGAILFCIFACASKQVGEAAIAYAILYLAQVYEESA